jgi:bacteriocin biosynthesis cyclodehydratase domain-containing protein
VRVPRGHVDADEAHPGVLEERARAGGEIDQAGAHAHYHVGLASQGVGRPGAGHAEPAHGQLAVGQGALAGRGLGHGQPEPGRQSRQLVLGLGVVHPTAGHHERPLGRAEESDRSVELGLRGWPAGHVPGVRLEEPLGVRARLGLHVLVQGDRDRPRLGRVEEDPKRLGQRVEELLGPGDPVEEGAEWAKGVVDAQVSLLWVLQRLHHRALAPIGEGVGGQEQHRHAGDGRRSGAGEQVRRAGADRRRARERGEQVARAREEESNFNRQILYRESDVGRPKVDAARESLAAFDSACSIDAVRRRLEGPGAVRETVAGSDFVVSAADWPAHDIERWVNLACFAEGVPFISMSHAPPAARVGPLYVPGLTGCFACQEQTYRAEYPEYDHLVAQRRGRPSPAATLGPVCAFVGGQVALEALHQITGLCAPSTRGASYIYDLRTMTVTREAVPRLPDCPVCGAGAAPGT